MSAAASRPVVLVTRPRGLGAAEEIPADLTGWLRGAAPRPPRDKTPDGVDPPPHPPGGALMVVSGLSAWRGEALSRLLRRRRDLTAVAVLGRCPATDWPEYLDARDFAALAALARGSAAVVVPDGAAGARLRPALSPAQGRPAVIVDAGIPSRLAGSVAGRELAVPPYMVCVGPSGSRANTALLLHLWREAAAWGPALPKLVLLGGRGSQVEEVAPLLDWNETLRPHVAEAPALSAAAWRTLLVHAGAVLMPDFCAPDGPLMRDALALGTRVLAADTPEARAAGARPLLSAIDGPGWRDAIVAAAATPPAPVAPPTLPDWPDLLDRVRLLVERPR